MQKYISFCPHITSNLLFIDHASYQSQNESKTKQASKQKKLIFEIFLSLLEQSFLVQVITPFLIISAWTYLLSFTCFYRSQCLGQREGNRSSLSYEELNRALIVLVILTPTCCTDGLLYLSLEGNKDSVPLCPQPSPLAFPPTVGPCAPLCLPKRALPPRAAASVQMGCGETDSFPCLSGPGGSGW